MQSIRIFGTTQRMLEDAAKRVSMEHPQKVVTIITIFDEAYCMLHKRITTYTPQDAKWNQYWTNGELHTFTSKHIAKMEQAYLRSGTKD